MDYLYSILFGLVQGATEFLPISSSGHLVILHKIFNFRLQDDLSFDVILHAGTLLALIVLFNKDIIAYLAAFFKSLIKWQVRTEEKQRLAWLIVIAALPAGFFGYLLEDIVDSFFRSPFLVAVMLILVGFLFIIVERKSMKTKEMKDMSFPEGLLIGLAQVFALIPGVSRSGITILAGLSRKLNRGAAARFSFLLSIPVIFGAVVKKISELFSHSFTTSETMIFLVGFLAASISGYLTARFLLKFLQNHSLRGFAYYRFILGLFVIIYFLLK